MALASIRAYRTISVLAVAAVVCTFLLAAGTGSLARDGAARVFPPPSVVHLPLSFEPNVGQGGPHARFVAQGARTTLFLARDEVQLSLNGRARRAQTLRLQFVRTDDPALVGADPLPGKVNYLVGRDRSRWHVGVRTYGAVRYKHVWPGIDASFYGDRARLEYDFALRPGADAGRIAMRFPGVRRQRIDRGGVLVLTLSGGSEVRLLGPVAYQRQGGRRHAVASRFVLSGTGARIAIGAYDHHLPLTIDPTLVYSSYLGGSGDEQGNAIAVDQAGNVYVTGPTTSPDFPATGGLQSANRGNTDAFVTKLNPAGDGFVYSTYLGGSGYDIGDGLALDPEGRAYVAGTTFSSDFPTTPGSAQQSCGDPECKKGDVFLAKLSPAGDRLVYSTYLGGNAEDTANGVAVDSSGSAYVVGATHSTNLATGGAAQTACTDELLGVLLGCQLGDGFLTKLNPAGSERVYSTYLGGNHGDAAEGIAVDATHSAYVVGFTTSSNFPTTPGALQRTIGSAKLLESDAFVSKLDPAGDALSYSTYLGGSRVDAGSAVAIDGAGDAYVTGFTSSPDFPTVNPQQPTCGDPSCSHFDAFVSRLSATGNALAYSTYLGGGAQDIGRGIALDGPGNVYVVGSTTSTNFPVSSDAPQPANGGREDGFLTKMRAPSDAIAFSSYLGGSGVEAARAVAVRAEAAYVTGYTSSTGGFPTRKPVQSTYGGGRDDAFVAKFPPPDTTPPITSATPPLCQGPVTVRMTDNVEGSGPHTVHFRLDGGPEQTTGALGASGAVPIAAPEGSHTLEYWGEDEAGNLEFPHKVLGVQIDSTAPALAIASDQGFTSYEIGDHASVTIAARDATSGLVSDPSRAHLSIATVSPGRYSAAIAATDHCGNATTASLAYTVIPNPTFARNVNLETRTGRVTAAPADAAAGRATTARTFSALAGARQVPVGTIVDATAGSVAITAALPHSGRVQTGILEGGRFEVQQPRSGRGLVVMRLIDNAGAGGCGRRRGSGRGAGRDLGHVLARVSGRFRTRGRYATATSRTQTAAWSFGDRCDGTLTRVTQGRVTVTSIRGQGRRKVLGAGTSLLTRAR
jgi:hypothetical protein